MEILLHILFLMLLVFYLIFLYRIFEGIKKNPDPDRQSIVIEFITIIIPFRNETENILNSLKSITNQDFPRDKYEVIYIDDCSEDDSLQKICSADKPENIRVLSLKNHTAGSSNKNQAVQYAIEQSKGKIIITTDCDCYHGNQWLRSLLSYFDGNTAFVSGPVIFTNDGSTFQVLQTIEFAGLILSGAGLIGIKKPIICNAANLGFRKTVYCEMMNDYDNLRLSAGDDEYLMRIIASKTNYDVRFAFNKEAAAYTYANENAAQFFEQRKRWVNNSFGYNKSFLLSIIFLFLLSVPVQLILGIFFSAGFLISFMTAFTAKMIMEYVIIRTGIGVVLEKYKFRFFFLAELMHIPYILIIVLSGAFGGFEWKNRIMKR